MVNANNEARRALREGSSSLEAMRVAKGSAAFSGSVRNNLVAQLNHWGVHQWVGVADSADFFGAARDKVHTTSLLRYPVFHEGNAYNGAAPVMTSHPLLRKHLLSGFAVEAEEMPHAHYFALGPKVYEVLLRLADEGFLKRRQIIGGMLHPSGQSNYRFAYLLGDRADPPPHRTDPKPYDAGRQAFRERFLRAA